MAKIFGQLEKAQLENTTADTAALPKGMVTFRTDTNIAKVSNGTVMKALIDEDSTQTMLNKTLTSPTIATPTVNGASTFNQITTPANPAAGTNKFYYKADNKLYTLDSAGNEVQVGSGAGGGGAQNLIANGSADDTSASIFVPYANTASPRPVTGLGGSPSVTTAVSSVNPLVGTKHYQLIKPASNCQGEGWAISNIALPLAYRGKSLKTFMEFILASGTFAPGINGQSPSDGDAIVYFYDQTNAKLMEPVGFKFLSNSLTISDKYDSSIQFDSTCTQVRMIIHVASTSALAWTLNVDNVTLSPSNYVYGSPITSGQIYTPTFTGLGTPTNVECYWKQIGDEVELDLSFTAGTTTAVEPRISLPPGLVSAGSPKIVNIKFAGSGAFSAAGTNQYIALIEPSTGYITLGIQGTSGAGLTKISAANSFFGSSQRVSLKAKVPIQGWSSSVQMSDGATTRIIGGSYNTSTQSFADNTFTTVIFTNRLEDTLAMYNSSTGVTTVQVAGLYDIDAALAYQIGGYTAGAIFDVRVQVNGSTNYLIGRAGYILSTTPNVAQGKIRLPFKANDTFVIQARKTNWGGSSGFDTTDNTQTRFSFVQAAGPQTIAASERIALRYSGTPGTSITTTYTIIPFNTKTEDTHGLYSTATGRTKFPTAGTVDISAAVYSTYSATANDFFVSIFKNGVQYSENIKTTPGGNAGMVQIVDSVPVISGDYIEIRSKNSGGTANASTALINNFLNVKYQK